jgi:hypothetical protein
MLLMNRKILLSVVLIRTHYNNKQGYDCANDLYLICDVPAYACTVVRMHPKKARAPFQAHYVSSIVVQSFSGEVSESRLKWTYI